MKRLLCILAVVLMATGAYAQIQTGATGTSFVRSEFIEEDPWAGATLGFGAVRWDDGLIISAGIGKYLGGGFWSLNHTAMGRYGTLETELAYIKAVSPKVSVGVMFGPNVDIPTTEPGIDPVVYLTGAAGAIAAVNLVDNTYLYGFAKYKFAFDNATLYQNGSTFGGGVAFRF